MISIANLGCGKNPFKNTKDTYYLNMDMCKVKQDENVPYVKHSLMKFPYPIETGYFDKVFLFHTIEHIPEDCHKMLLGEIHRILKPDGIFVISYPEFKKIAQNYIENVSGKREFWKKTIYGRGLSEWDRHKSLMDTEYFLKVLKEVGFWPEKVSPERTQSFNTVVICKKGDPMLSYETLLGKEFSAPST